MSIRRLGLVAPVVLGLTACTASPATPAPTPPTTTAATTQPAAVAGTVSFGDGEYVVNTDVEPGTYRTTQAAPVGCYWWVYLAGSDGRGDLDHLVSGGSVKVAGTKPSLTVAAGQAFQAWGCGTWERVG